MPSVEVQSWPFIGRERELVVVSEGLGVSAQVLVVITGPAGVGKTRLARHAAARLPRPPLWLQASQAVAAVPFGALSSLDAVPFDNPTGVYRRLADEAARAGNVVIVDDAPHLDARTADLLHRLSDAQGTSIVATARSGLTIPSWIEWLWLGEATRHLTLEPFDDEVVGQLVAHTLGDSPAEHQRRITRQLVSRTNGNALFVRALLTDLVDRHTRGDEPELPVDAPEHLLRVLQARLDAVGDAVEPLRVASILGEAPLSVLRAICTDEAIAASEQGGWITIDHTTRALARPGHPLYAQASLAGISTVERRTLTSTVASRVLGSPGTDPVERLTATAALVDLDAAVDTVHIVEAARTAFSALDHTLATRLARAAVARGDRFESLLVLGAALSGDGSADEAETILRAALRAARTDDERARSAGRLSVHLVAFGQRIDEAAAVLEEIAAHLKDPAARSFIAADRAKLASIRGELTEISLDGDTDDLSRVNAAIVGAFVAAMAGDAKACRETMAEALPLAATHAGVLPWSGELIRFSGPLAALLECGPDQAAAEASAGRSATEASMEPTVGTWRYLEGFTAAISGRLDVADAALSRAIAELDGHDLIGARPLAVASLAWVNAQAGRVEAARSLIDDCVDAAAVDGRVKMQLDVADAWCDAIDQGTIPTATPANVTATLLRSADDAVANGQVLTAHVMLNELIRLGDADAALVALEGLVGDHPSSWFSSFVLERARAVAGGDDAALQRLAHDSDGRWPVVTAELYDARARLAQRRRDEAVAMRWAFMAIVHRRTLGTAVPMTVSGIGPPLTAREIDVAAAVGRGATNRAVAESAGVSVRTVENQLQSIYRKLDLASRAELTALFDGGRD